MEDSSCMGQDPNQRIVVPSVAIVDSRIKITETEAQTQGKKGTKRKKGVRNPHLYKQEVIKNARLKGESYINSKGVEVPAKITIGPECLCKDKCTSFFSPEEKIQILKHLYDGKPKNEQDTFLMGLIDHLDVARRRPGTQKNQFKISLVESEDDNNRQEIKFEAKDCDASTKRNSTFKYYALKCGTKRVSVCKRAFMSLYAIKNKPLYRLCFLKSTPYASPKDMRGRHNTRPNVIPQEAKLAIDVHVTSFPLKQSEFNSKIKYLDSNLNVKKMHIMFKEKFPEFSDIVSYECYRQHFKNNYNYCFGQQDSKVVASSNNKARKNSSPKKKSAVVTAEPIALNNQQVPTVPTHHNLLPVPQQHIPTTSQYVTNGNIEQNNYLWHGHIIN